VAAAPPRSLDFSAAARIFGTTRDRSGLAGANTPWYLVRWARGFGTSPTSLASTHRTAVNSYPDELLSPTRPVSRRSARIRGCSRKILRSENFRLWDLARRHVPAVPAAVAVHDELIAVFLGPA
jgi:hypothetical protein